MYKRTKIVCTMGPACDDEETIREMIEAGMNIARFNFSHGTYDEQFQRIERVRKVSKELGIPVGIMLDTKGPEVRTGYLENHDKVLVNTGDHITVTACPASDNFLGTEGHISLDYVDMPKEAKPGSTILIDDGLIALEVESINGQDMTCLVKNGGYIKEQKGVNTPDLELNLPAVTDQDREDIFFGISLSVDFIACSFIQNADAVREIREMLVDNGGERIAIISKIECAAGVKNFDEILEESNGIMVARGDMGVELPPELVPHYQKEIIRKCNEAYKPVITATQMLDSMQKNPRPTRAEVSDVANAINDGTDAVMLSGETAAGKYPVEAVKMQAAIAAETEKYLPDHADLSVQENAHVTRKINNLVGLSAVGIATEIDAKCITISTDSGRTARLVSHFRPRTRVVAFSRQEWVVNQMLLYWGVEPFQADIVKGTVNGTIVKAVEAAKQRGIVERGDITVCIAGDARMTVRRDYKAASTNVIYVAEVQ